MSQLSGNKSWITQVVAFDVAGDALVMSRAKEFNVVGGTW